jgi:hypothetical protein
MQQQLTSTVWGEGDEIEGQFWGNRQQKGQGGGNLVGITSSPLNQFQINFLSTPEQKKHWNLFRMDPGSKAALLAPW